VTLHSGSRGLGYQVCDDSLDVMLSAARKYGIELPDRQLCCAPVESPEGRRYLGAMAAAANYAFANRQMMTHWVRETFEKVLGRPPREIGLEIVYDVCHNIAKMESHEVEGRKRRLCVHRKGATRAFPPHHPETPASYREVGQPVLIPGDMGRYSFVLAGTEGAFRTTWGSTCHGAGRRMSRTAAKRSSRGRKITRELEERGIILKAEGRDTVLEEVPEAYKDVARVVDVVHGAGIARKVARLVPIGVIKG
jgi:tRNA-splicing ligase RtcB